MKVKGFNGKTYFWKCKGIDWQGKSRSKLQEKCKAIIALYWGGDMVGEEQCVPSSKMAFDFVNFNKKLIVEVNGDQHYKYNKFFHNKNVFNFVASKARDDKKKRFAEENGFTLIEVKTPEELNRILLELSMI
jgi:hypothetical protein